MLFIIEHLIVNVINMYSTFQVHEYDGLTLNPNLEEARYYFFLNLEFVPFLLVCFCIDL